MTNRNGETARLRLDHYQEYQARIDRILAAQDLCEGCDGSRCPQEIPYWVQVVRSSHGIHTLAVYHCGKEKKTPPLPENAWDALKKSVLPPRFAKLDLQTLPVAPVNQPALRAVQQLAQKGAVSAGIFFTGPSGSGKTRLACALLREASRHGQKALFLDTQDLLAKLRDGVDKKDSSQLELAKNVPLLCLDDFGHKSETEWVLKQLHQIVICRYNSELPTLFTSTYALKDLTAQLVPRSQAYSTESRRLALQIVNRLREMCHVIEMTGTSQNLFA